MTNKPATLPKSPRRKGIEAALLFLGLGELIRELFASPDDIHRQLQSEAIADTGVFEWKRWVTSGEDNVCTFCQDAADHGLYSIDYEMLSHPNCRCSWEPVIVEGQELPSRDWVGDWKSKSDQRTSGNEDIQA